MGRLDRGELEKLGHPILPREPDTTNCQALLVELQAHLRQLEARKKQIQENEEEGGELKVEAVDQNISTTEEQINGLREKVLPPLKQGRNHEAVTEYKRIFGLQEDE